MHIPNSQITSTIQLALAPVFLLMAVVALITAVSGRLARVIDRMRFIHAELLAEEGLPEKLRAHYLVEYIDVKRRGRLCAIAIFLDVLSGVLISLTVLELFFFQAGVLILSEGSYLIYTFIAGLVCFVSALVMVLVEVVYAYRSAVWDLPIQGEEKL